MDKKTMNPTLYMLVGVPGSGKTTWIKNNQNNAVVLSTDDYIEQVAKQNGKTYSEVFKDTINQANAVMNANLSSAVKANQDIIWDQTNLTVSSRRGKLNKIPKHYRKIAVFFPVPSDLRARLASRPGKEIPEPVIVSMINQLQLPSTEEGFDRVITAG